MSIPEGWLQGEVRVLDGARPPELRGRGNPLLDEEGREALLRLHRAYVEAGAEVITAHTLRLDSRSLRADGIEPRAQELRDAAVGLARRAGAGLVAGNVAPLGACGGPVPNDADDGLRREHRDSIAGLVEAGVDLILAETMGTVREAVICADACRGLRVPFLASFACASGGRLLSGETLSDALAALAPYEPLGVLVNCTGFGGCRAALESVMPWGPVPGCALLGIYPNIEEKDPGLLGRNAGRSLSPRSSPVEFAALTRNLVRDFNLKLVGGCCGSTPGHIAALASAFRSPQEARP